MLKINTYFGTECDVLSSFLEALCSVLEMQRHLFKGLAKGKLNDLYLKKCFTSGFKFYFKLTK